MCQHSWENMANFGKGESSKEESLFTMGEVEIDIKEQQAKRKEQNETGKVEMIYIAEEVGTPHGGLEPMCTILDTGFNKSTAGRRWTAEHIQIITAEDKDKASKITNESKIKTKVEGRSVRESTMTVVAPVQQM